MRRYADLLAGFCGGAIGGCDWARLQGHWDTAGRAEGRQFACLAKPPSPPTPPTPPHPPAPPQPYPPPPRTAAGERINARWTNGRCLPHSSSHLLPKSPIRTSRAEALPCLAFCCVTPGQATQWGRPGCSYVSWMGRRTPLLLGQHAMTLA